jgi:paired amphipathic helix protein Sin3a
LDFSQGYYETLLDLIDKFFEGDVDQQSFEECSRYIFGTKAYLVFTIDKLVHILAKQIHTLVTDEISIALLSGDRLFDLATTKSVFDYNKYAEELVGKDENIYQANFVSIYVECMKAFLDLVTKSECLGRQQANYDHPAAW